MITDRQREKARIFSAMHKENRMFVLPNAWDVGSAYVFEKQGFKAVATSSAGIAYDLGYPDGEDISFDDLLYVVGKIANRIEIPLSVDFERGYSDARKEVKANARKLLFAGAVGFNIEDGLPDGTLSPLDDLLEKIKALSELKQELDIDFVINARTCAYWLNVACDEEKLRIAFERGNAFAKAGADCVFIPGALDKTTVEKLVRGINAPVNIILNGAYNDFAGLEKLGVCRLSVGSGPVRYVYDKTIEMSGNLIKGDVRDILINSFTYAKANEYFLK
ncbi:MAG: isocitrate lyase/PEP mutase family protein [Lachnospiraceae bacterium]